MKKMCTLGVLLLLAACSPASIPDVTYYRLPPPQALPRAAEALSVLPIQVGIFLADGIYGDQALIYAITPDADALRTYHYQLWSDPPSRALQTRLTQMLRAADIAPLVTERLPASDSALRIHATIRRYERVKRAAGYVANVAFEMRVEQGTGEPMLEQTYAAQAPAADATMVATVQAFGVAVDQAFAAFFKDLIALNKDAHAD